VHDVVAVLYLIEEVAHREGDDPGDVAYPGFLGDEILGQRLSTMAGVGLPPKKRGGGSNKVAPAP
jgi:hypothetical protein